MLQSPSVQDKFDVLNRLSSALPEVARFALEKGAGALLVSWMCYLVQLALAVSVAVAGLVMGGH